MDPIVSNTLLALLCEIVRHSEVWPKKPDPTATLGKNVQFLTMYVH